MHCPQNSTLCSRRPCWFPLRSVPYHRQAGCRSHPVAEYSSPEVLCDQARAVAAIPAPRIPQAKASDDAPPWECLRSEPCGEPCHLPSSAGNTVTMELATVNDENPCGDRGLDAVRPPVAIDGTDSEKWRRRESNPRPVIPQKRPLRAYSVDWSHCRRFHGQDTPGS